MKGCKQWLNESVKGVHELPEGGLDLFFAGLQLQLQRWPSFVPGSS